MSALKKTTPWNVTEWKIQVSHSQYKIVEWEQWWCKRSSLQCNIYGLITNTDTFKVFITIFLPFYLHIFFFFLRNMFRTSFASSYLRRCIDIWKRRGDTFTCVGTWPWLETCWRPSSRSSNYTATCLWRMLGSTSANWGSDLLQIASLIDLPE